MAQPSVWAGELMSRDAFFLCAIVSLSACRLGLDVPVTSDFALEDAAARVDRGVQDQAQTGDLDVIDGAIPLGDLATRPAWLAANGSLYGGAVYGVVRDPVEPSIAYVTSAGGVYKTVDNAATWTLLAPTLTGGLTIDPATHTTLYSTTDSALFTSTDGGATWEQVSGLPSVASPAALGPQNSEIVYVGTQQGVWKSTNGGMSWEASNIGMTAEYVADIAVDPTNSLRVFAVTPSTVFVSTDAAAHWTAVSNLPMNLGPEAVIMSPTGVAYVVGTNGLYRSSDGGGAWSVVASAPVSVGFIVLDPTRETTIYALSPNGTCKSVDDGATWSSLGLDGGYISGISVDPQNSSNLLAVCEEAYTGSVALYGGGILESTDSGSTWVVANRGFSALRVDVVALDPRVPSTIYAATYAGLYKSANGAGEWSATGLADVATSIVVDPTDSLRVYAASSTVFASSDSGATFTMAANGDTSLFNQTLVIDPVTPTRIYAGVEFSSSVYKTVDGAASWIDSHTGLPDGVGTTSLVINPLDPSTLYASTEDGLFKTTNGGSLWSFASTQSMLGRIAIDPKTPTTLYAFGQTLQKSIDGGVMWVEPLTGLPTEFFVLALAIDPMQPQNVFLSLLGKGVWKTTDGAMTWSQATSGLDTDVHSFAIDPVTSGTVYAGTAAHGVFKTTTGGR